MSNYRNDPAVDRLVTAYEEQFNRGEVIFFEEKAYLKIIEFYENDSQLDKALEVSEYAVVHHPYSAEVYARKAQVLIGLGKEKEALAVLEQARPFAPMEREMDLLRAEALIGLDELKEAMALLDDIKPNASKSLLSDVYLIESMAYESREEYERMFYALKAAIDADPENEEAMERFGLCVEMSRNYQESIAIHEAILENNAYSAIAWFNLGQAHYYLNNYEKSVEAYDYAFLIDDSFEDACRECADLCFELKQYKKALEYYQELLENFDTDGELYTSIGQCYQHLGRYKSAATFYRRAAQMDPLNDEVLFFIGECYASEQDWRSAIHFFEKAIQIEEQREDYYLALGEAYSQLGETEQAEAYLRKAVETNPEESHCWAQLASFLMENGEGEAALVILDQGEEEAVGTELLYYRIACLYTIGRKEEAYYRLGEALLEDFDMHRSLFEVLPEMEHDERVIALISTYMA